MFPFSMNLEEQRMMKTRQEERPHGGKKKPNLLLTERPEGLASNVQLLC